MEIVVLAIEVFGTMYVWFAVVSTVLDDRARKRGEPHASAGISQIAVYGWIVPLALLIWPFRIINNFLFG